MDKNQTSDHDRRIVTDHEIVDDADRNPDPITGAAGAHPIGTGVGAASAGAAGLAIGSVAGPVGAAVGAVVGAVAGGLAGKGIAENINPTVEEEYWRENYHTRPYVESGSTYEHYHPAYQHGWESSGKWSYQTWEEAEPELRREWETNRGEHSMDWDRAKHATRDAWERIKNPSPESGERDVRKVPR